MATDQQSAFFGTDCGKSESKTIFQHVSSKRKVPEGVCKLRKYTPVTECKVRGFLKANFLAADPLARVPFVQIGTDR